MSAPCPEHGRARALHAWAATRPEIVAAAGGPLQDLTEAASPDATV